jgi:hypothetical protein
VVVADVGVYCGLGRSKVSCVVCEPKHDADLVYS